MIGGMKLSWRNRPEFKQNWPKDIDIILFIDETGDSKYEGLDRSNNKYFTIAGCAFKKEDYRKVMVNITELKKRYWEDGMHLYKGKMKRVCFHSYEIRRGKNAFSEKSIERKKFLDDLNIFMKNLPIKIFAYTIVKEKMISKYSTPFNPYNLSMEFILERFVKYYLKNNERAAIILESRGKKEDGELLKYIKNILDNGTRYATKEELKRIKGVYFNEKWCKEENYKKSYFGLEIADLVVHPISMYNIKEEKNLAFKCIENKIYGYPQYKGKGIKKFP